MRSLVAMAVLAAALIASQIATADEPDLNVLPPSAMAEFDRIAAEGAAKTAQEEAWRAGPQATADRERSRTAYASVSNGQALDLLRGSADQLAPVDELPLVEGGDVDRYLNDYVAVVDGSAGDGRQLAISSLPLRAPEGGTKEPVDLGLEDAGSTLTPTNSLVDLRLPEQLGQGISLGSGGLRISVPGTEAASAERARIDTSQLAYPNIAPDTDLIASAVPQGLELFESLRSPQAPEEVQFKLDLPSGTDLRSTSGGGAEIMRGNQLLTAIPPPTGKDAQGAEVPVTMEVVGDLLSLRIPHRSKDLAYPLTIDPAFAQYEQYLWASGDASGINDWVSGSVGDSGMTESTSCAFGQTCYYGSGANSGLYIYAAPGSHPVGYGIWLYTAPGATEYRSTYISQASFYPVSYTRRGSSTYPVLGMGIYDPVHAQYVAAYSNSSTDLSSATIPLTPSGTYSTFGKQISFFLSTNAAANLTAYRDAYLGGGIVYLDDKEAPTNSPLVHSDDPSDEWIDNQPRSFDATASDAANGQTGVGMKYFNFAYPTPGGPYQGYSIDQRVNACTGTRTSPCPASWTQHFNYDPTNWTEGISQPRIVSYDALLKPSPNGNIQWFWAKVDHSPPDVTITGGLTNPSLPNRELHITANDGNPSSAATQRSGVKTIAVTLDGAPLPGSPPSGGPWPCSNIQNGIDIGSCSRTFDYQLPSDISGSHTLRVSATDQLGHSSSPQVFALSLPDGTPPDTIIDDGPAGPTKNAQPTFTFHANEAGSTFNCRFDAAAFAACSGTGTHSPTTALSEGQHTFEVRATDASGNNDASPASRTFVVDTIPPDTTIDTGPDGLTAIDPPTFGFHSSEAGSSECHFGYFGPFVPCDSPTSHTAPAPLGEGPQGFQVRAVDLAGNVDPSPATRDFEIDTKPPITAIQGGPYNHTASTDATFSFLDIDAETVECQLDDGGWSQCTSPRAYSNLSVGDHTFSIRGIDATGNVEQDGEVRQWTVDTTVPATHPGIDGEAALDEGLSVAPSAWPGGSPELTYQWLRCADSAPGSADQCTPINGATDPQYTPTETDLGKYLRARVANAGLNLGGGSAGGSGNPGSTLSKPSGLVNSIVPTALDKRALFAGTTSSSFSDYGAWTADLGAVNSTDFGDRRRLPIDGGAFALSPDGLRIAYMTSGYTQEHPEAVYCISMTSITGDGEVSLYCPPDGGAYSRPGLRMVRRSPSV
jgi:hypothetical protein